MGKGSVVALATELYPAITHTPDSILRIKTTLKTHTFVMVEKSIRRCFVLIFIFLTALVCLSSVFTTTQTARAEMPFYGLKPSNISLRAEFSTDYSKSTEERKSNIYVASKSLNNAFIDVGGEFSFNRVVGERTEKRGYKKAKIIVGGKFVDGVGGGVCQVSTTVYNAVLRAGLKVIEYHPHSLPVSYVDPSFDAMVNSGNADLKFINNTHNPIILQTVADGNTLTVKILGEPMKERYLCQGTIIEYIQPETEEVFDDDGLYPNLYEGESLIEQYPKKGYKSIGRITKVVNGKTISSSVFRKDKYNAVKMIVVKGKAIRPDVEPNQLDEIL